MGDKYLSDVISAEELINSKENRICILAGVGAGKNYFVTNFLRGYGNILFISSRRATINEMLQKEICKESVDWSKFNGEIFTTTNYGIEQLVKNERFSSTGINNIIEHYDIIVVDEFHSLKADATFANSTFHVYTFLNHIVKKKPNIKIIAMTGTKEPVKDILLTDDYFIIDKRKECKNVLPKKIEVITKDTAINLIKNLPEKQKTIYYTTSTETSIWGKNSLYKKLIKTKQYAETDIAFAVSGQKANEIQKKEGAPSNISEFSKETKAYIVQYNDLPEKCRLLITTATLKEGVNIESEDIKIAFCESHLLSDIQQFAGRVRKGLDTLYIINNAKQFDITSEKMSENHIELLLNINLLANINEFFKNNIKSNASSIYRGTFTNYSETQIDFYNEYLFGDWSIYSSVKPAQIFIDAVENKFNYIRFNHLKSKFELFVSAFKEESRINEYFKCGWEKSVREYCFEKGIWYYNYTSSKEVNVENIKKLLFKNLDIVLSGDEKKKFLENLSAELGCSPNSKFATFNKKISELELFFEIKESYTTIKGDNRRSIKILLKQ